MTKMTSIPVLAICLALSACASSSQKSSPDQTFDVCTQQDGCERKTLATLRSKPIGEQESAEDLAESGRIEALERKSREDARAAFDLALRFFRGDGVRRDSRKAVIWMRDAAERGHVPAQVALGRLYLSGFEEMGPDYTAAESWLMPAASQGDAEAAALLTQAQKAKADEASFRRWVDAWRMTWLGYWWRGYPYYLHWHSGAWYFR